MTFSYHAEQMKNVELKKEIEQCKKEVEDSKKEMSCLKRYILEQHELGFTKALG